MVTIYKKDTKGNIRYLTAYTTGPTLFQESGIVGTDKPIVHSKTCKSKNVGRSNETSPAEQAESELQSLIAEKLKEGYFKTEAEAEGGNVILPMLAKSYKDEAKKVDWSNAYAQPKLDGMRCLATLQDGKVTLMSREGTEITTVPHIIKDLKRIKANVVLAKTPVVDPKTAVKGKGFKYISHAKALELMENNKGQFFTAIFKKKDQSLRTMNCQYLKDQKPDRLGYIKVKETKLIRNGESNVVRSVNLQTLEELQIGKVTYKLR